MAYPILLAWRLRRDSACLGQYDPLPMILRAAAFLILHGPVTAQERWEENAGYSPSTLAVVIAALACAADFWSTETGHTDAADFILAYADWLAAHVDEWTVTTRGELVRSRLSSPLHPHNPTDSNAPDPHADPNTQMIRRRQWRRHASGANIVGGEFFNWFVLASALRTIRSCALQWR